MSDKIRKIKKENILNDAPPPMTPELNDDIYYNCSDCSSLIEIKSINEDNNTIEFSCLNKDKNHNYIIPLKEYIEKMQKYRNNKLYNNKCDIHNNVYISYCFNCNCHLCQECLKTRIHLNHIKNNLIEIQPMNEELIIIKEVILDYEIKIENLSKEKKKKIKELNKLLNQNKNNEDLKLKEILKKNEKKKKMN